LAEKKFELVYGAATNDWSPRINSVRLWKTLSPVDSLVGMQQKSLNILYGWTPTSE
jgi:hypothetical protein